VSPRETYQFSDAERASFDATIAFIKDRLAEQDTLDWALALTDKQEVERRAVLVLLDHPPKKLPKVWNDAWRLVEESWGEEKGDRISLSAHQILRRVKDGDRSQGLIDTIVRNVRARLEVTARPPVKKPKDLVQLLGVTFTSARPTCHRDQQNA
jgi:hypothetical protein